ncbi:MAG: hypothetical protein P9M11_10450 [Candidatus Tenebribacter burtonii]|nr:hypothetical protein [Candidatus Tenebribacter burtonii]
MKTHNKSMIILLSIIIFEIAVYIILIFHKNICLQDFSTLFSNFLTPLITAIALLIYYLTLIQMRKQTKNLIEEKNILLSENTYTDFKVKIQEIKESVSKKDLSNLLPKDIKKSSFTTLTIYTGLITELIKKLKADKEYNKFLNKDIIKNMNKEELFKFSTNNYYISLNSIYNNLSLFLYKINFILFQIEEKKNLHESHKNLLMKFIAKEVLTDYFLVVLNKEHFNYSLIPSGLIKNDFSYKFVFDVYDIEKVYNFYRERYAEIIDEVLFLKRQ